MRATFLLVTAVAVVVSAGLVHGFWTDRWQASASLEEAGAVLDRVGPDLGPWHGEAVPLDARTLRISGASHYVLRHYTRRGDKANASVLLMCGRSGPMSVHTPDLCYGGSGYEMVGSATKHTVAGGPSQPAAEFWTARFLKQDGVLPEYLRVYWSWKAPGGAWTAPDNPRLAFGRPPVLCKLYLIHRLTSPDERPEEDPCLGLVQRVLAELEGATPADASHKD
jgi:hypothetical protein